MPRWHRCCRSCGRGSTASAIPPTCGLLRRMWPSTSGDSRLSCTRRGCDGWCASWARAMERSGRNPDGPHGGGGRVCDHPRGFRGGGAGCVEPTSAGDDVRRPVALRNSSARRSVWSTRALAAAATIGFARNATPRPAARSMSRSLAPSPTAIVADRASPRLAAQSLSVASFVSRSSIGSATRPVSAAPSSSSTLDRC